MLRVPVARGAAMTKCFDCGQEIESGQESKQTRYRSLYKWQAKFMDAYSVLVCTECVERHRRIPFFVFFAFCLAFGILGPIAFFLHW